jgi:photosystem II stability/assembly factor-like uncharacterized protein
MDARARHAVAAVGLAVVLVAVVGVLYLRPWQALGPAPERPSPSTQPTPMPQVLEAQFPAASAGWVVTGRVSSASLFHTTDGGRHWQRQLQGTAANRWSLWFFDAERGVVAGVDRGGPALWSTRDGGQRWARAPMTCLAPPPLVFFLDLDHGWCVERPGGEALGLVPLPEHQQVALLRTADGGVHWTQVLATDQAHPVSGGLGDDGQKAWIWFRDANTGWIGQHSPGGNAAVSATVDGGDHWNRQELPSPAGGWGPALGTWQVGPPSVGTGPSPSVVLSLLAPGSRPGQAAPTSQYVYSWQAPGWTRPVPVPAGAVVVADRSRWLVANGTSVQETSDGGDTWSALGAVPPGWRVGGFTMVDADHGWAVLRDVGPPGGMQPYASELARTTDGGRHWALVTVPS